MHVPNLSNLGSLFSFLRKKTVAQAVAQEYKEKFEQFKPDWEYDSISVPTATKNTQQGMYSIQGSVDAEYVALDFQQTWEKIVRDVRKQFDKFVKVPHSKKDNSEYKVAGAYPGFVAGASYIGGSMSRDGHDPWWQDAGSYRNPYKMKIYIPLEWIKRGGEGAKTIKVSSFVIKFTMTALPKIKQPQKYPTDNHVTLKWSVEEVRESDGSFTWEKDAPFVSDDGFFRRQGP